MAGSVNKVTILGNLGADPDCRAFQNGGEVVNLRIATSETWKDKNSGDKREKTEWHQVAIFSEGLARVAKQYLKKGSKVYIEGKLQTRKWQDQSGADRYSTEIVLQGYDATLVMLDGKSGGDDQGGYSRQSQDPQSGYGAGGRPGGDIDDIDSEIPFEWEGRI